MTREKNRRTFSVPRKFGMVMDKNDKNDYYQRPFD